MDPQLLEVKKNDARRSDGRSATENSARPPDLSVGNSYPALPKRSSKDRTQFVSVLRQCIKRAGIDVHAEVLVIGGMQEDADVLCRCGFHRITLSNINGVPDDPGASNDLPVLAVDAEDIYLPDNSFDIVFVHEVIHHCRSPHLALCEMLRVAKRHVLMMEPNDSAFMRLLSRLRLSFPFELAAVVNNDYVCGGVRNSPIPNFIFRWNGAEVHKLASSFLPEYAVGVYADPYWDFNLNERNLADRKQTNLGLITRVVGASNFLWILHQAQHVLNRVPILRHQGNKFFGCLHKSSELRPWLICEGGGRIAFDRRFQRKHE
jgi:SAM-dependent methyltransferase